MLGDSSPPPFLLQCSNAYLSNPLGAVSYFLPQLIRFQLNWHKFTFASTSSSPAIFVLYLEKYFQTFFLIFFCNILKIFFSAWGSCGLTSPLPPAGLACSLGGYSHHHQSHHHQSYDHRHRHHHCHDQRMCSETSGSSEEDKPIFQPLTRDSLAQIQVHALVIIKKKIFVENCKNKQKIMVIAQLPSGSNKQWERW